MVGSHTVARSAVREMRGTKQTCVKETCGSPYYDLGSTPPTCPYCGTLCDDPAITRIDFETLGKQQARRLYRRAEPPKPVPELCAIEGREHDAADEHDETEPALPSAAEDLLIENDDEAEALTEPAEEMT